jgi:hypothetical protein
VLPGVLYFYDWKDENNSDAKAFLAAENKANRISFGNQCFD